MWESCFALIFKLVLMACLSSTRVVTLPVEVHIVPGLSLVSSEIWINLSIQGHKKELIWSHCLVNYQKTYNETGNLSAACLYHTTSSLVHIY